MHRDQMREMPVLVFGIVEIVRPFLQLSPLPDLRPEQPVAHRGDFLPIIRVHTQRLRGLDVVREQIPRELLLVGIALRKRPVFRRLALRSDQLAGGIRLQRVFPILAQLLHYRVRARLQILLVLRERVMIPQVLRHPRCVARHPMIRRAAKNAVLRPRRPPAHAKLLLGRLAPHFPDGVHPVGERKKTFRQIRLIHEPVIHLHVHVRVIIGAPRWIVVGIPHPLQVGRQVARSGTADHQIPGILKQQLLQIRVRRAFPVGLQPLAGRQRARLRR